MLIVLAVLLCAALGFGQGAEQQPNHQPGWPCTGKERSFDPVYAKIAEASGGHLMLFDKSEVSGASVLAIGDMKHKETIVRAAGKIDSYVDIPVPVDSSVESLFVTATLQCMQTVYLYDPQRSSVTPTDMGGEDAWFRAGRIATILKPMPGQWIVRLLGTGPYFVSVQARTSARLGNVTFQEGKLTVWLDPEISAPTFRLVNARGEPVAALPMETVENGHYEGRLDSPPPEFRVLAEWTQNGEQVQRMDARLFQAKP